MPNFMRNDAYNAIEPRNADIVFIVEFDQNECDIALDNQTPADRFQFPISRVRGGVAFHDSYALWLSPRKNGLARALPSHSKFLE
jgi:hypothetical protein